MINPIFTDDQLDEIGKMQNKLSEPVIELARRLATQGNTDIVKHMTECFPNRNPKYAKDHYRLLKRNRYFSRLLTTLKAGVMHGQIADRQELMERWTERSRGPEELLEMSGIIEWRPYITNMEDVAAGVDAPRQVMAPYLVSDDPDDIPQHLAKYIQTIHDDGRVTLTGHIQPKDQLASEKLLAQTQGMLVERHQVQQQVITTTVEMTPQEVKEIGQELDNSF